MCIEKSFGGAKVADSGNDADEDANINLYGIAKHIVSEVEDWITFNQSLDKLSDELQDPDLSQEKKILIEK